VSDAPVRPVAVHFSSVDKPGSMTKKNGPFPPVGHPVPDARTTVVSPVPIPVASVVSAALPE
jgi:hypothetical protein